MNKLVKLAMLLGPLAGLNSCSDGTSFQKTGKVDGYNVRVICQDKARRVLIRDSETDSYITGLDLDGVEGFEEIRLRIPKGHPLENYVNPRTLEQVYESVKQ